MLLWGEGVDFAAPVSELAACNFPIDLHRYVMNHLTWLAADSFTVVNKVLCAESLDSE